jgi:hypothetical protein
LRTGILTVGLPDDVTAFLFGHSGDGAGVDEVEVGFLVEVHDGVPFVDETSQQVGRLREVQFASQGMCGDSHFFLSDVKKVVYLHSEF